MELAHLPGKAWAALTTAEGLGAWFGNEAMIDLRPGGAARMRWAGGHTVNMRVERVEEPTVFGFTWHLDELDEADPRRTYVEFTLEPAGRARGSGRSRLVSPSCRMTRAARRTTPTPRAGRASWASWPITSMPLDIEAIAEQVFAALADPTRRAILAALASGARPRPPTWPPGCRSPGRRSASTWPCWPGPAW